MTDCTFPRSEIRNGHSDPVDKKKKKFEVDITRNVSRSSWACEATFDRAPKNNRSVHSMLNVNLLLSLLIVQAARLTVCDHCCEINYHGLPRYDLMRKNSRSNQPIISRKVVSNVSECEEFAASKKALAFNFLSTGKSNNGHKLHGRCHDYSIRVYYDES